VTPAPSADGPVHKWTATAPDAEATAELGRIVGATAPEGAVVLLAGPLGAGKTTFAQGVARGCGVVIPVSSPTYNLVLHYAGRRPFIHVDLYRLETAGDLATLDLDEIVAGQGVTCVEWPELLRAHVAPPSAEVTLEHLAPTEARRLRGRFAGPGWERTLDALADRGAVLEA
jgi:tRNA threonylcarbamoyladenosine biosynthesis protein TsaE